MTTDPRLTSWITEALRQQGSRASGLAIARWVWSTHESALRDSGDLLYTWQLDLQACAEAMLTQGALALDANGDWSLADGAVAPRRRGWTEPEIAQAVQGYLALLIAEGGGAPARRTQVVADLVAATGRSTEQVEAMLCNISAVVQEHDLAPLAHYRPRSNVPVGVRPAVAAALATIR